MVFSALGALALVIALAVRAGRSGRRLLDRKNVSSVHGDRGGRHEPLERG